MGESETGVRGFTPMWTASTVRILELVLMKFGDFALWERIAGNLPYPRSMGEKFVKMGENGDLSLTHCRSGLSREYL